MVEIFYDRLEGRFLKPIRLIINGEKDISNFSGFSILALDCLIIETLQQFYSGENETKGSGTTAFWHFFESSPYFKDNFSMKTTEIFYSHFRCGLLHQAQTKKKSLIRIGENTMISQVSDNIDDGLIVDRAKFHEAIEQEIKHYINLLENNDTKLRINFVVKMRFICNPV